ncbi:putative G-protein coupled receptor [Apostichopus japonicus]|uniref:Putative G-protein coupled receptor n=1 Tax=Stichopus japonicus TaxID=307972 RepID=A0A2G8JPN5_STIJA|nr:putative G-protein coupled receptor [Apostichopus japonicus]
MTTSTLDASTSLDGDDIDSWEGSGKFFRSLATNAVAILSIALNTLSLLVLRRSPTCFGETTKLIIIAMSIMDLSTGVQIILMENLSTWSRLPDVWSGYCKLAYPSMAFIQLSSTMFVVTLSIDRLIIITRPLRYPLIVTKTKLKLVLLLCLIPPSIVAYAVRGSYFFTKTRYCRMYLIASEYPLMFLVSILFLIAILITTYVNAKLFLIASRMKKQIAPAPEVSKGNIPSISVHFSTSVGHSKRVDKVKGQPGDLKALRTVLIITMALYIGWFPFFVRVVHNFVTLQKSSRIFEFFGFFAGYNCSWFNPVVYLLMNTSFRREALLIFKRQLS